MLSDPTLEILETVLRAARTALLARHPGFDDLMPKDVAKSRHLLAARMLLDRLDDLRDVADWYREVIEAELDDRLPF